MLVFYAKVPRTSFTPETIECGRDETYFGRGAVMLTTLGLELNWARCGAGPGGWGTSDGGGISHVRVN